MGLVQGLVRSMRAIEAQGGSVVGEPYMRIEQARETMRALMRDLEAAVRNDLEAL